MKLSREKINICMSRKERRKYFMHYGRGDTIESDKNKMYEEQADKHRTFRPRIHRKEFSICQ